MAPERSQSKSDQMNGGVEKGAEYLLSIDQLLSDKGYVRGVELADMLGKSRPTVTRALQRLSERGLVNYERYRGITLTDKGKKQAQEVHKRYKTIREFLVVAGIKEDSAEVEAQRLVADVSEEVLSAFNKATRKLKKS